jgi:16S rRNA processing protein RimM
MVLVAEITGAHGVGGNVRAKLIASNADVAIKAMEQAKAVTAKAKDGTARILTLKNARPGLNAKNAWSLKFKELTNRSEAEEIYGYSLYVPESSRPILDSGEFYVDELVGMTMITDTGFSLGTLTEVLTTPANDVYVSDRGAMVPAVPAFIVSVDPTTRIITISDVAGLRDDLTPEK